MAAKLKLAAGVLYATTESFVGRNVAFQALRKQASCVIVSEDDVGAYVPDGIGDLGEMFKKMAAVMEAAGAVAAVGPDGKGYAMLGENAPTEPYVLAGKGWGVIKTKDLVLIFSDVCMGTDRPPHFLFDRPDLCPNVRTVKLADYWPGFAGLSATPIAGV